MKSRTRTSTTTRTNTIRFGAALMLASLNLQLATAATVIGTLKDISIQALNTRLLFAPTNEVLVTPSGLSAGPPKIVETANGDFSVVLEAGDYTVSLPLIPWRRAFAISVMDTNGTVNITNLLSPPRTYTYTNNLDYTVKATAWDTGPDVLDNKLSVAGSLSKSLVTNSGVVTVVLSNNAAGSGGGPLHVNTSRVDCWSTNGESSLLDGTVTFPAGSLVAGSVVTIEAFGVFNDPGANVPTTTFKLKLGSVVIQAQTQNATVANWHVKVAITVRTAGASGSVVGTIALAHDNPGMGQFGFASQTATVDTTGAVTVDLRASVADFSGEEGVGCEQLLMELR